MKRTRKILKVIGIGLLVLAIILVVGGFWFVRRPWPQTTGTIVASGLSAPTNVIRDKWGVPHIYAQNDHDLFFAQGYVHAQDRLWQMEWSRRVGSGTLAEILGQRGVDNDRFFRTLGARRAATMEWDAADDDTRAVLEAYAQGVNDFIQTHRGSLPLEFTILGVNPAPWTPVDTLTWGRVLSFSLSGNYRLELLRALMIADLGPEIAERLLPPYGKDKPIIVPPQAGGYAGLKTARFDGLDAVDAVLGDPGPVWGSNNWVVAGSHTATGKPMLANDTHLGLGMPSIWYENGLHGGRFDSVGFTFPGVPAVVIGHNQRIAWGVSNLNPDTEDFYLEKLDDRANPTKYEFQNQWQDLQIIKETIQVKGAAPVALNVLITRHGSIMNDVVGELKDADPMALHWTGMEGTPLFRAIVLLNQATNWEEFRHALSYWGLPSQNFVYADVDGNIGYQTPGQIPIRATGHTGMIPVPGWTGENEWQGYIPFDKLPNSLNPERGFIATANNKVVGDDYPYHLASEWDPGYRAKRITDMLSAKPTLSMDDMRAMEADTYSLPAEALAHYLLAIQPQNDLQARALAQVKAWDLHYETDRAGASVYQVWYWFLLKNTLHDELGEGMTDRYLAGQYERHGTFQLPLMTDLMAQPNEKWFDDRATPQVETRDDIVLRSLADAIDWLSKRYGNDPAQWTWGRLHTITLVEAPLGQSGIKPVERIFNSPTIPARGDNFTVDAGSFRYSNPFTMVHGSSQRMIVDLSNLENSLSIQTTGQSGQAFHPHRLDFVSMWQNVEYHPQLFSREKVDANAEAELTLTPQ